MTIPTIAEVGHGTREPGVVEIDGFRGRLISPEHADYDIARAVWNGAIDRPPAPARSMHRHCGRGRGRAFRP